MSPRPILKRFPSSNTHHDHHAVHFPPSPSLTRTFEAHCPSTYDRSPIVVLPNSCALPERGCPGRTYAPVDGPSHRSHHRNPSSSSSSTTTTTRSSSSSASAYAPKDLHPRAFSRQYDLRDRDSCSSSTPMGPFSVPPPLIPDLSSESEESDGFASPAPEPNLYTPSTPRSSRSTVSKHPSHSTTYDLYAPNVPSISPSAAFPTSHIYTAPPAPSHSSHGPSHTYHHPPEDVQMQKARRRRDRERKRERSRERDRIRDVLVEDDEYDADLCSTPKVRSSSCYKTLSSAFSSLSIEADGGCLDGF
ncbi:hypothetical protein ONZ45_g16683 [Pleurotus djamor]|nr:hypothetical protein ONZ45_g16683 [Pleurotus djamor]